MGQVLEPKLTISVSLLATLGSGLLLPDAIEGKHPLSTASGDGPVALSPRKQAAQCPTCCAQHARREWREDCAGSSDEDEGAEALAGFFRLVVDMWGVFCGRISWEASGTPQS
eukprot:scaffold13207_cov62-Phaeocystis_antarctica.AAC.3